jgi:hypothetical protein
VSLERLLADTLHQADDYEPSPDLFARVERSLAEDLAHRRRVRLIAAGIVGGIAAAAALLVATTTGQNGAWLTPAWALELVTVGIQVAVMITIGPSIRRFGQIYVADCFRLSPETGARFLSLFDVAFYLLFSGRILMGIDLSASGQTVATRIEGAVYVDRLASFLLLMGVAHALTLSVLPVVGLIHGSTVRRARRMDAVFAAPPVTPAAARAERVVKLVIWSAVALALMGGIVLFVLVAALGIVSD